MIESREKYYISLIKESLSLREVCLKAGLVVTTGNYDTLKRIIKDNLLYTFCKWTHYLLSLFMTVC